MPWWQWSHFTGDWGRARSRLKDAGLEVGGDYTFEWSVALAGDASKHGMARGLLSQYFTFDPQPCLGITGGQLFAQYFYRHGPNASAEIGDIQGFSNLDAERLSKAGEFWYEQKLFRDHFRLKVGQVDANAEFAFVASASEFLNSSAGYSPTILGVPTYPNPRLSLNLFAYAATNYYIGGGVYGDSAEDGGSFRHPFGIVEAGVTKPATHKWGTARLAFGGWHSSATLGRYDGREQKGTSGFYAVAEQQLWGPQRRDPGNKQGLTLFAQYGFGDSQVSPVAHHAAVGLFYAGLISKRPNDSTGLRYSYACLSRAAGSPFDKDESSLEWFYRVQITPAVSIKPDLQWIRNPGGYASRSDAWVGSVRIALEF